MTDMPEDVVERVARAMWNETRPDLVSRWDDVAEMVKDVTRSQARAALVASGYVQMREALETAATELEHTHDVVNDGVCQWSEETERHCGGLCNQIGCLDMKIKAARAALAAARGET